MKQVFQVADAGCEYQNMSVTLREHPFYVLHKIHPVLAYII